VTGPVGGIGGEFVEICYGLDKPGGGGGAEAIEGERGVNT
jgi:hypothetical protein